MPSSCVLKAFRKAVLPCGVIGRVMQFRTKWAGLVQYRERGGRFMVISFNPAFSERAISFIKSSFSVQLQHFSCIRAVWLVVLHDGMILLYQAGSMFPVFPGVGGTKSNIYSDIAVRHACKQDQST